MQLIKFKTEKQRKKWINEKSQDWAVIILLTFENKPAVKVYSTYKVD